MSEFNRGRRLRVSTCFFLKEKIGKKKISLPLQKSGESAILQKYVDCKRHILYGAFRENLSWKRTGDGRINAHFCVFVNKYHHVYHEI